ncbi:dihydroorotase [Psychrobium sp. 1_MG-2023]|uniref:dihydroorotase n=1 Tax=Psychrobium sp. 1_MG-2023 TaxID=3062624 RepID=UPI000C3371E4|nr:dihydroorotase [Psychrobium sp. 1_MG-2023]MDP2561180.1 dihydroorotase [Psychrobium sp. 1_MG-2023]PKF55151.1 dihydroorotase [Alteromonadales bacterium alter-6D02]
MQRTLIKQAIIINEGQEFVADVLINGTRIEQIEPHITALKDDNIFNAHGCYLLPGMIDDQVHFREPGLTHKGSIASESRAAVAGGITSYMEMPNVNPATTSIEALEAKFTIAEQASLANYSFYLGATESNLEQIKALDPAKHCGVKVFMGASTGDLLVEHPQALEQIFQHCPTLIVTHCESSPIIDQNLARLKRAKSNITIEDHPLIRDEEACFASSSYAVNLAKKYNTQLHVLHITTAKELSLFSSGPIAGKSITAEACVHHLWFNDKDYSTLGNLIKCNPSIKTEEDQQALLQALQTGQIDIIATDHAPHTLAEKQTDYLQAPAGLPLVESALLTLLDHVKHKRLTMAQLVEKVAHNPATRYKIMERGYIREGYFADLVLIDPQGETLTQHNNSRYLCGWTPFNGHTFSSKVISTWVNGQQVYDGQNIIEQTNAAQRLLFSH